MGLQTAPHACGDYWANPKHPILQGMKEELSRGNVQNLVVSIEDRMEG